VEDSFSRLFEVLQDIEESASGVASLRKKLRAYVDFGLNNPSHYHCAFVMRRNPGSKTDRAVPHPAFEVLRDSVRDCVEQGQLRSANLEITSQGLWAAIHGITALLISRPEFPWEDRDAVIDHVIDTALTGLGSPETRR
jgi:hypothetical protein